MGHRFFRAAEHLEFVRKTEAVSRLCGDEVVALIDRVLEDHHGLFQDGVTAPPDLQRLSLDPLFGGFDPWHEEKSSTPPGSFHTYMWVK